MSIHKLTAGSGYDYLTRQVAALDATEPHTIIRPETLAPRTPTEILHQILARNDTPTSASTQLRVQSDPASRLYDAVRRYTDGVHVATEQILGPQTVQMLDTRADQVVPELTNEPSWPTLRAHLLGLAAETGEHPLLHLHTAAAGRELHTAADMAAVLDWRLPNHPRSARPCARPAPAGSSAVAHSWRVEEPDTYPGLSAAAANICRRWL